MQLNTNNFIVKLMYKSIKEIRMDTEELLEKWLESIKTQVKDRTLFVYKSIIRLHILPKLGKYKLSELSGRDMQDFVISLHSKSNPRTGKCLSSNMIAMIFSVLKASFNYAVFNEYLRINPCIGVKKGKNISKKVEAFSKHEQTILENYCKENSKYFGVFLLPQ